MRLRNVLRHLQPALAAPTTASSIAQQPREARPKMRLSEEQERQFWDDGFVVVHAFEPHELQPFHDIVDAWLSEVADELLAQGAIASDHAELDIFRRMAALEVEAPGCSLLIQNAFMRDRKLGDASVWSLPELRNLRSDHRILDLCEQLVGSEVAAHPNAVLRCRAPTPASGADGGRVPWHQGPLPRRLLIVPR